MSQLAEKETVDVNAQPQAIDKKEAVDSDVESTTTVNEKSLLRKLDLKLLPAVSILYLLSFLDRSNVGNARVEGLTTGIQLFCYDDTANAKTRPSHDGKPVPHWPHSVLCWLRTL
jgi:hypothetical protein